MKHQEFIELLNLYVDHEITDEEAARLEVEVMHNPERRKTYEQYCRIQKACHLLAGSIAESADAPAPEKITFFPARPWAGRLYAAGLVAAAACVAVTITLRHDSGTQPAAVAPLALVEPQGPAQASPALQSAVNLKPVLASRPDALFADSPAAPRLDWISQVRIAPVQRPQAADLVFVDKPADLRPVTRPIPAVQELQGPVEMTAFQFTK
jgi:hypothetical protein